MITTTGCFKLSFLREPSYFTKETDDDNRVICKVIERYEKLEKIQHMVKKRLFKRRYSGHRLYGG